MRSIPRRPEATRLGVAILGVALATVACEADVAAPLGPRREVPPTQGGVLRSAFFTDVRSLDAATAFDTASAVIEGLIYDQLVTYDRHGKLSPQLAESIEVSPDGLRYTFTLRRGVLFHDGAPLGADDVKRSVERTLHPDTPCPVPSYYERIVGWGEYHEGRAPELTGVRVESEHVVSFQLAQPDATFLHVMALPIMAPVCESAGRTWTREFSRRACGAGPYRLVRFEHGDAVEVERHDGYWQSGKPYVDRIVWYLAMQPFTQRFKFERGDLDYIRELGEADSLLYRRSAAWQGLGEWEQPLSTFGVFMNAELRPFDNRHVRRAVAFALDRDQLAQVRPGHVAPTGRMTPDAIAPEAVRDVGQRHDLDRALEEMRLAGLAWDPATRTGGWPEEIEYLAILDSFGQQAGELLQQQLARIGLRVRIQLVGFPTYLARTGRRRTVPMGSVGWNADYPEPSTFFEPILTSRAIQDEESQNASFFSNAELDALLARARVTTDEAERGRLYRRAEEIVRDEAPWAVAYSYRYFELWQPYLHGYRPHPVLQQDVRFAWLDRGARPARAGLFPWRRRSGRTTLALATVLP
ncbi:MAG: ABC transporter substrate-binding protein [Polyangiaceae bacterium]|nr:ABC transporter substrate-binding protein [Polyangiaceae bacterium]